MVSNFINQYFQDFKYYINKYGEKTILLIRVGDFYESYAESKECVLYPYIVNYADQLDFAIKQLKDKIMTGFPFYTLEKHVNTLLKHNFVVIVFEQVKDNNDNVIERKLSDIYTPGTHLDTVTKDDKELLSIYIDVYPYKKQKIYEISVCKINICTGKNYIYEIEPKVNDINYSLDELYKFVHSSNAAEIIINITNKDEYNNVINFLNIKDLYYKIYEPELNFKNINCQKEFLDDIFNNNTQLDIFTYLNIDEFKGTGGRIAYILLLLYIKDNNKILLNNINLPLVYQENFNMILTKNAIKRLNILTDQHNKGVFDIVNFTNTIMGKRELKKRILYPIFNKEELNRRYDLTKYIYDNNIHCNIISDKLKLLYDLDKLNRLICTKKLNKSNHLVYLITNINIINDIINYINDNNLYNIEQEKLILLKEFYNELNEKFNIDLINDSEELNIFNKNIYEELDNVNFERLKSKCFIDLFCKELSIKIQSHDNLNKKKQTEIDENKLLLKFISKTDRTFVVDFKFEITESKAKLAQHINNKWSLKIKNKDFDLNENISFQDIKWKCKDKKSIPTNIILDNHVENHYKNYFELKKLIDNLFQDLLETYSNKYCNLLIYLSDVISEIDIACSNYKNIIKNNYCVPVIEDNQDSSYVKVNAIRHPIIEHLIDTIYITNDVELNENGILLYGTNASGKSSLMKSIGLSVILAQAGLCVPASSFIYKPYYHFFVRIGSDDNLYMNESSFTNEMNEVRDIMKRSDNHSLIIGDELCSGTEVTSATCIVASTISYLSSQKSSFLFATHFHQLTEIEEINNLPNLHIKHLSVIFDNELNCCVYNRILKDGQGSNEYGLEVMKSLNMTQDFVSNCYKIRNSVNGLYNYKQSNYNKNKVLGLCEVCKENEAIDTHHITHQEYADENGNLSHFHKNHKGNLAALCKECHDKHHRGIINIEGYKDTNQGRVLYVKKNEIKDSQEENTNIETNDLNDEEINFIIELDNNSNIRKNQIQTMFYNKFVKKITEYKINKIRKNKIEFNREKKI